MKNIFIKLFLLLVLLAAAGFTEAAFAQQREEMPWSEAIKKAENGDAEAQCYVGSVYYFGTGIPQDYREARKWYLLAAEQGNAKAQYNLGLMYSKGEGVPKDYSESYRWYTKAAEAGDAVAQSNLGLIYEKGDGVPKDTAKAVRWYQQAAEHGNAIAQWNLGNIYWNGGIGVPKNLVLAHLWVNIAGANGFHAYANTAESGVMPMYQERLETIEKQMTDSQKEKAMDLARELFAKLPKGE